jgi:hypothetical protein
MVISKLPGEGKFVVVRSWILNAVSIEQLWLQLTVISTTGTTIPKYSKPNPTQTSTNSIYTTVLLAHISIMKEMKE